jgi:hypothetical protein
MSRKHRRNRLRHEILETRQLLAGDAGFSPWTNPIVPTDVTGDSFVTARDALVIINQLSRSKTNRLAEITPPPILGLDEGEDRAPHHLDTTGDGLVTARDALLVINHLTRQSQRSGSPEGESTLANDAAIQRLAAEGEATAETIQFSDDTGFAGDFGRVSGTLSAGNPSHLFHFVAMYPRVTVDLSSADDDQVARVVILDQQMREIASSSDNRDRKPFEGIDVSTQAGAEYFIRVVHASPQSQSDFSYALSVYQFEPSRWLPPSAGEVIVVGDDGDLPDTIAEALDIAIRMNGSSFEQTLETPGDVDVIALPNGLPGSVFLGGLDGIAFELLTANGTVLQPQRSSIELRPQQALGYFSADDLATIGEESLFLRIESTTDAVGTYNVSVLFDGGPHDGNSDDGTPGGGGGVDQSAERILDAFDVENATAIDFTTDAIVVEGETQSATDIDFFIVTSRQIRDSIAAGVIADNSRLQLIVTPEDASQLSVRVFRPDDSNILFGGSSPRYVTTLPKDFSVANDVVAVAVFNERGRIEYSLNFQLNELPSSPESLSVTELEAAVALPAPAPASPDTQLIFDDEFDPSQTVLYRLTASGPQVRYFGRSPDGYDGGAAQLETAIYDASGNRVDRLWSDSFEAIQFLLDRMGAQAIVADTDIDQELFLRVSNPLDRAVSLRSQLS